MDYYTIAPLNYLRLVEQEPRHLVEACFLEGKILDFYAKLGKRKDTRIIIDNGTGVNKQPLKNDTLLDLAHEINANEIVIPDHWNDGALTVEAAETFVDSLSDIELRRWSLMGVPHGRTIREWFGCYESLLQIANVIGLAYREWNDRSGLIRCHYSWDLDDFKFVEFHLLGLWNARELLYAGPRVRSFDTSLPFRLAQKRVLLERDTLDIDPLDWDMELDEYQQSQASFNLGKIAELAGGKTVRPTVSI